MILGGDLVEHKEIRRTVAGANTAVLFIHGIIGTPNHFDMLLPLVPDSMTLYNLLLDGHGKGPLEFGRSSMRKWERQVRDAVAELADAHDEILIVGHSMGALFAIEQALEQQKIKGLFLIAIPITPWPGLRMLTNAAKIYFDRISPDDKYANAARHCYGIGPDRNPLHYCRWVPRYFELFDKVCRTRKALPMLTTPCAAYQSLEDEMVSRRSIPYLRKHAAFPVFTLERSGHTYYDPEDLAFLKRAFSAFVNKNAPI